VPSMTRLRAIAVACLLCGLVVNVGGAQVGEQAITAQPTVVTEFLNTGLFQLKAGGEGHFYVSFDGKRGDPAVNAVLRLFDQAGTEIARNDATLGPGQVAAVSVDGPGLVRGQAIVTRRSSPLFPGPLPVKASVEVTEPIGRIHPGCTVGPSGKALNTGPFSVPAGSSVNFYVSIHDPRLNAPAEVILQILDRNGTSVASRKVVLAAGQSTVLRAAGPGLFTANAQIADAVGLPFLRERAATASAEVIDAFGIVVRPVCSVDLPGVRPPP